MCNVHYGCTVRARVCLWQQTIAIIVCGKTIIDFFVGTNARSRTHTLTHAQADKAAYARTFSFFSSIFLHFMLLRLLFALFYLLLLFSSSPPPPPPLPPSMESNNKFFDVIRYACVRCWRCKKLVFCFSFEFQWVGRNVWHLRRAPSVEGCRVWKMCPRQADCDGICGGGHAALAIMSMRIFTKIDISNVNGCSLISSLSSSITLRERAWWAQYAVHPLLTLRTPIPRSSHRTAT